MKYAILLSLLITFIINVSNCQVFNTDAIPLTPGAYLQSKAVPFRMNEINLVTGNIKFVLTRQGMKVLYNGEVVWFPYDYSSINPTDPVIRFKTDGNLCLRENYDAGSSDWCTNYYGLGAQYLNLLPEGSYGRKWAIITQDVNGKMVWGRFGPAISTRGIMPLIPGNFIDAKSSSNKELASNGRNCINNGRDYLCSNARESDALSFYAPLIQSDFTSDPFWKISNPTSGSTLYKTIFGSDSNFCVTTPSGSPTWCNGLITLKQRYLVVPIASDYENYNNHNAWVVLDDNMNVVFGRVAYFLKGIDKSNTQIFPSSGVSNEYLSMSYNTNSGVVSYTTIVNGLPLGERKLYPDSFTASSYTSQFKTFGYELLKKATTNYCTFTNQNCVNVIETLDKPVIKGDQTKWDTKKPARWVGMSRMVPELVVLDEDSMIIASTKNYGRTQYQY